MKLSSDQVRCSLLVLEDDDVPSVSAGADAQRPAPVPAGVSERIAAAPRIRADVVAQARACLDGGDTPTADELARAVVGRLISDRLR